MAACCTPYARSTGRCFSRFARRYRRRFERRGLEASQRQLVAGLEAAGFAGASLLEIGSGVGYLHQLLLERGAATATGIDLAPAMVEQARDRARARGLEGRTRYLCGDYLALAQEAGAADVTLLDKVVCCYPDVEALVQASLARTRRVYALTYPRDRALVRLAVGAAALALRALGSDFRPYVHDPERIRGWITAAGFTQRWEARTPVWLTQVFARGTDA